jgi:predicted dehydrogenase
MRVGIVGAGTISEYHIAALRKQEDLEISAIFDVNQERARAVAGQYRIPTVAPSLAALLGTSNIEAVTVGVWNAAHSQVSCAALEAGKHVFCEKPMARTVEEATPMVAAERASGRLLMIGLVRRFELRSVVARSIMQSGALGDIYLVRAGYLRRDGQPGGWFTDKERSGGGSLMDIGIHSLDLGIHLAGLGAISAVSGYTRQLGGIMDGVAGVQKYRSKEKAGVHNVEDHVFASLRFSGGALMTLEASWAQHRNKDTQYLEIYGSRGGLVVDPALRLYSTDSGALRDAVYPLDESGDRLQNMFDSELAHFVACVRDGVDCLSPSSEGLRLIRIIETIYRSADSGREQVLLEPI